MAVTVSTWGDDMKQRKGLRLSSLPVKPGDNHYYSVRAMHLSAWAAGLLVKSGGNRISWLHSVKGRQSSYAKMDYTCNYASFAKAMVEYCGEYK